VVVTNRWEIERPGANLYPYNRFRYLNPDRHLTTIMTLPCSKGIILAADTQLTSSQIKEVGTKIIQIGDHSLLACSGYSDYIETFRRMVKDAVEDTERDSKVGIMEILDSVRASYKEWVNEERQSLPADYMQDMGIKPFHFYPDAIFSSLEYDQQVLIRTIIRMKKSSALLFAGLS